MKNFNEVLNDGDLNFDGIESSFFLLGLISAFENRYQAKADAFFEDISWKQFFAIICINLCKESPTIKEIATIMGSSHQNVKQILNKLEKRGYVEIISDEKDKRKQRVILTEKTMKLCAERDMESKEVVGRIFSGVDEDEIKTVIKVLLKLEDNLKQI